MGRRLFLYQKSCSCGSQLCEQCFPPKQNEKSEDRAIKQKIIIVALTMIVPFTHTTISRFFFLLFFGANLPLVHAPKVWFSIGAHSLIFGINDLVITMSIFSFQIGAHLCLNASFTQATMTISRSHLVHIDLFSFTFGAHLPPQNTKSTMIFLVHIWCTVISSHSQLVYIDFFSFTFGVQ